MDPTIKQELISQIRRRLTPQAVKIRADVECTCFGYEGIDAIKAALKAGEELSTPEVPIKVRKMLSLSYKLLKCEKHQPNKSFNNRL